MTIPNDYTVCETYRGFTIGLKAGTYWAFYPDGRRSIVIPPRDTRAGARRQIDHFDDRQREHGAINLAEGR